MKKITRIFCMLIIAGIALIESGTAGAMGPRIAGAPGSQQLVIEEGRFWQKTRPEYYAFELTEKVVQSYPKFNYFRCHKRLSFDPKAFLQLFESSFSSLNKFNNELTFKFMNEARILKKRSDSQVIMPEYLSWLGRAAEEAFSLNNYESILPLLAVGAMEADFWPGDGSFDKHALGRDGQKYWFLFTYFMNLFETNSLENRQLNKGLYFVPSTASLRKQLEYLTSEDYSDGSFQKPEVIDNICARIDSNRIESYVRLRGFNR